MLLTSIYALLRLHISLLIRTSTELELGVIALRHEVALLRHQVKRPHLTNVDRIIFAGFSRDRCLCRPGLLPLCPGPAAGRGRRRVPADRRQQAAGEQSLRITSPR